MISPNVNIDFPREIDKRRKLTADFYRRDAALVARELLGKIFIRKIDGFFFTGRIVETEAYKGKLDEASHSFIGKTERNKIMFEAGGLLYVYFIYGAHYCANVVTGNKDEGEAALLRGIEPITGIEQMALNRFGKIELSPLKRKNLTNGPGKICKAFSISKNENGCDLTGKEIFIVEDLSYKDFRIGASARIGISRSVSLPWRYFIENK